MSNRASSFPADRAAARWYRERWPWLLIAGPAIVVVASLTSAWLAVASDDALVGGDYYKQGLMINRKLESRPEAAAEPSALLAVADDGRVRVRLQYDGPAPQRVLLSLRRPGEPGQAVALAPASDGTWGGAIQAPLAGRWIVALESNLWRLPVTTVQGRIGEIRLGATAAP